MSSNQSFQSGKKTKPKPYKYFKFFILEVGMRNKCREKKPQSYWEAHLLCIWRLGSVTSLFLKSCHMHCHEYNLSQVTLAKWMIFLTCGTHFLRVFSPSSFFFFPLFSGPLKKEDKNLPVLDCLFGSYSVFHSFLSLPRAEVFQGDAFIRTVLYFWLFSSSVVPTHRLPFWIQLLNCSHWLMTVDK